MIDKKKFDELLTLKRAWWKLRFKDEVIRNAVIERCKVLADELEKESNIVFNSVFWDITSIVAKLDISDENCYQIMKLLNLEVK